MQRTKPNSPAEAKAVGRPAAPARALLAAAALVLAIFAAYANSLRVPFVFDDGPSIVENESIRHWGLAWHPPGGAGETVAGRPVLNLTFAFNHAVGGLDVRGYHAVNGLIHAGAALLLFGLVRRTLRLPALGGRWRAAAEWVALTAAALWALHPLQTESVTYVVQRAESLAGFFCLLTLWAFVRSLDSSRAGSWLALSAGACLLGMGTKEVMASTPLLVLCYDRTFVGGTFAAAWRRHGGYYLFLAATWLLLAGLVVAGEGRGHTAGLDATITPWTYALTQCQAVVHYLRLAAWPQPLVFDYGTAVVDGLGAVWPQALGLLALAAATLAALWRRPVAGFFGLVFFAALAPSSSVVPIVTQTMAEHRMYLALAALAVPVACGLFATLGRTGLVAGLALAAVCGGLTVRRNADYRSEETLWRDTAAKNPGSARAHSNLGVMALEAGRADEAISEYQAALTIQPAFPEARSNLGVALLQAGRAEEAVDQLREAVRLSPAAFKANYNLATALTQLGRLAEARPRFEAALRTKPDDAATHNNLGNLCFLAAELPEAAQHYAAAVRLDPANFQAHNNLAAVLAELGRYAEAEASYEAALRLQPDYAKAREGLARLRERQAR